MPSPGGVFAEESPYGSKVLRVFKVLRDIPQTIANMAIILINQADYLLFRQLQRLSKDFIDNGGFSERMYSMLPFCHCR